MTDSTEYTRFVPLPVWPPTLGGPDPAQVRTPVVVPKAVYEFVKSPGDRAPLTSPYANPADELASLKPRE
jgi:hypothetical protein